MAFIPQNSGMTSGQKAATNTAAPINTSNVMVTAPGTQSQIKRLQNYASTSHKPISYTQPGYEILFYSRFSTDSTLNLYGDDRNFKGYSTTDQVPNAGGTKYTSYGQIPMPNGTIDNTMCQPTFKLTSRLNTSLGSVDVNRSDTPVVSNISVHQAIDDARGTIGAIQLIQPDGVEFFKPTIGDKLLHYPDIDFHYPGNSQTNPIRIGVMDTILIRMTNNVTNPVVGLQSVTETVFRGVIGDIRRIKTVSGSQITLAIFDFSEYLRQITALPLGTFSTINFQLTGRGYTSTLLRYANQLYSGRSNVQGINSSQAVQIGKELQSDALSALETLTHAGQTTADNSSAAHFDASHAMNLPPVFWLQYSPLDKISVDNSVPDDTIGTNTPANPNIVAKFVSDLEGAANDVLQQATKAITTDLNAAGAGNLNKFLTPEDQESIQTYRIFQGTVPANVKASVQKLFSAIGQQIPTATQLTEIAWALSDLYLEKGLISFEHEQVWQSIFQAASRTLREVYFDFSPKLRPSDGSKGALVPFDTATVPEIRNAGNQGLKDIHPNIGILKYRLSPCFIPYNQQSNVRDASQFRFYSIKDDQIIEQDGTETEQNVFTAIFGYGGDVGKANLADLENQFLAGQSQGLFAYVHTLDSRIESRIGFRFMSTHDKDIKIPILMYLTSYSILHKNQTNMFQQSVTVVGDPTIQPGSIVNLQSQKADYYCTQVLHNWGFQGYTTQLQLQYGHTTGEFPTPLTTYGSTEDTGSSQQNACTFAAMDMAQKGITNLQPIGGINISCLVYALEEYMTGVTITNTTGTVGISPTAFNTTGNSGSLNQPTLEALFKSVCTGQYAQYAQYSQIMSWIALGETGGQTQYISLANPDGHTPGDPSTDFQYSYGLWQVSPGQGANTVVGDPSTFLTYPDSVFSAIGNAQLAVQRLASSQGFGAWNLAGLDTANPQHAFTQIDSRYNMRVSALLGGTPNLSTSNVSATNLPTWPYKVYGPIGMQLTSASEVGGSTDKNKYMQQLLDSTLGTQFSIKYIQTLALKYKSANFAPYSPNGVAPGTSILNVTQSDTLAKVIAAWYTDDGAVSQSSVNIGTLANVIQQVKSLYNSCTLCQATAAPPFDASSNSELNAGSTDRKLLLASPNLIATGTDRTDLADPTLTTDDLIQFLYYACVLKNNILYVTAVRTDHSSGDGGGPGSHGGGYAVDCRPCSNTSGTFADFNSIQVTAFLRDVAAYSNIHQIGLGGNGVGPTQANVSTVSNSGYQIASNFVAAGSPQGVPLPSWQIFSDNDTPHIHIGVN